MKNRIVTLLVVITGMVLVTACDDSDDAPPPAPVKVFATADSYDGNFVGAGGAFPTGLDGADDACTTAATNAGLTGTWTAWLSDGVNGINAADRIFTGGRPYELVNGTVIAANFTDLTDGMLNHPISIDESGNALPKEFSTWTATTVDGLADSSLGSCQGWTTNDAAQRGRIGYADQTDARWTDAGGGNTCNLFNRLYCFADAVSP
mgnify:CR=1 FL=1